ncbi:MAG: ribosome small subunit-dependent GTPase A [Collinsella sp.]|nr:ribosome small subunit-dependent GTPase A [Collinsella sp.]
MGKRKVRTSKARCDARRIECDAASLPKIDALRDVPAFGDLRHDETQVRAFESFVDDLRASGEVDAAGHMRLGCVVRLDRGFPLVASFDAVFRAEHAVAFAKGADMLPAIGDWVAVRCDPGHDMGVIERVLPRRTVFERWRGKNRGERQVLAANVDVILIVQPLGSPRDTLQIVSDRIARSMVLVNDCGATPVVVLTKADRVADEELDAFVAQVARLVGDSVRVIVTSSADGRGLDEVRSCIPKGAFGMILGESGAGKSTLLNTILGHEALATSEVRERDDMGRHTTVARVMVALPEPCGVVADAPGLRSLPLVGHERGLALTFPEIVAAARACRFNDCTHTHEPGCAVRESVEDGSIEPVRVDAFLALAREMRVSAQSLDPDIHL